MLPCSNGVCTGIGSLGSVAIQHDAARSGDVGAAQVLTSMSPGVCLGVASNAAGDTGAITSVTLRERDE
uniref:Uncharacterized protein n=1 Tax=Arundo donax TaxID=35708 RepID=A0A0A9FBG7_ARUDO